MSNDRQTSEPQAMTLFQALEQTFDFSGPDSFLIIGSNGGFVNTLARSYGHIKIVEPKMTDYATFNDSDVSGADFDFTLLFADGTDGVDSLPELARRACAATRDIIVVANVAGGNQEKKRIKDEVEACGFSYWTLSSDQVNDMVGSGDSVQDAGETLVFKRKKFADIHSDYFFQKIHTDNTGHRQALVVGGLHKSGLQRSMRDLQATITAAVKSGKSLSILRAGDGDYYFLRKIPIGSAKPGKRALKKEYDQLDMDLFKDNFWHNDIISPEIDPANRNLWLKFIFYDFFDRIAWRLKVPFQGKMTAAPVQVAIDKLFGWAIKTKAILVPVVWLASVKRGRGYREKALSIIHSSGPSMEAVYALVASRWLFRNFPQDIGIITGGPKLELIKRLSGYAEYRDYLGIDRFAEYYEIPQIGAADDVLGLSQSIGEKIRNGRAKILLVAAGSSKLALVNLLKKYTDAVIIDIGCGMDALAGVVCQERPYFADWVDYRLKDYDYSKVDFMDQGNPAWDKPDYKTIILD